MEAGFRTPFLDIFRRGEVDRDIRLLAARGALGLRADEQRSLLELLVGDPDPEIARTAEAALRADLVEHAVVDVQPDEGEPAGEEERKGGSSLEKIAAMNPAQRLALAMTGTREERAMLIRDPNKIVAVAVLSSPKMTETEIERIAQMANVSDEILRIIGTTRAWTKSYGVVSALTRNPKTPLAVSMNLLSRLHEKDVKMLAADRNVPDVLRIAARKKMRAK
ncbi:MAG: hypothetical protein HYX77_07030 [Acidobacteria bacterium]|nr:hypothetical protein [Acidobacteriota bacterium]